MKSTPIKKGRNAQISSSKTCNSQPKSCVFDRLYNEAVTKSINKAKLSASEKSNKVRKFTSADVCSQYKRFMGLETMKMSILRLRRQVRDGERPSQKIVFHPIIKARLKNRDDLPVVESREGDGRNVVYTTKYDFLMNSDTPKLYDID
jgi:hypothetical protein